MPSYAMTHDMRTLQGGVQRGRKPWECLAAGATGGFFASVAPKKGLCPRDAGGDFWETQSAAWRAENGVMDWHIPVSQQHTVASYTEECAKGKSSRPGSMWCVGVKFEWFAEVIAYFPNSSCRRAPATI